MSNDHPTPLTAASLTHQHLLAAVHTLARQRLSDGRWQTGRTVRLLDAGCGDGVMLSHFARALPTVAPELCWEFHGYDVSDSEVQEHGFFDAARERLSVAVPGVSWRERLHLIRSYEPWPFPDDSFDVVVSNQVGEHIEHFDLWLHEQRRTLVPHSGFAVHLFPLVHYPWESHLSLPYVHRILSHDLAVAYSRTLVRLGFSFRQSVDGVHPGPLDWGAASHADYLRYNVWYRSGREVLRAAKRARLRASFRFCGEMLTAKLRQKLGRSPLMVYRARRPYLRDALRDWSWYVAARYAPIPRSPGVTLVLERENVYRRPPVASAHRPP
jgi:SAM-dependent methyltransferase